MRTAKLFNVGLCLFFTYAVLLTLLQHLLRAVAPILLQKLCDEGIWRGEIEVKFEAHGAENLKL